MIPPSQQLLDADILQTFAAIAEEGSFTAAAKTVNRTPSAVSMQIKKLEEQIGRPVFKREGRSVHLTPDGEALLGYSRRLIALNREAIARFMVPELEGRVRFGAPDDFGTRFLPNILARFAETHPNVEVDVMLAPSQQLVTEYDQGNIDIILVTAPPTPRLGIDSEIIHVERLVWVGLREGAAALRDPIPLALSGTGCAWRGDATRALDKAGVHYRIAYSCENCQGQLAAIMADLAIAPLPASLLRAPFTEPPKSAGLPALGTYRIERRLQPDAGTAAKALSQHITDAFASATTS